MDKESIEYKLACFGFFGSPVSKVDEEILFESVTSGAGEIITEEEIDKIKKNIVPKSFETSYKGDLDVIKDDPRYYVRLKTAKWRDYVLKGNFKSSLNVFILSSVVFTHLEGISREELKAKSGVSSKRFSESVAKLMEKKLIYLKDDKYFYSEDSGLEESNRTKAAVYEKERLSNISKTNRDDGLLTEKRVKKNNASQTSCDDDINKSLYSRIRNECKKYIEESSDVVSFSELKEKFWANDYELEEVLRRIQSECRFNMYFDYDSEMKIIPESVGNERRMEIVLDIVDKCEIILLSDWKARFKSIYSKVFMKNKGFILNFFEENGFMVLEIFSKNTVSETVIYKPTLSKDSEKFKEIYTKGVLKIGSGFKDKITRNFFKNISFAAYDNLYDPDIKKRVNIFYRFIEKQMEKKEDRFIFNRSSLLEMDFISFATCVPLNYINLLPEIIIQLFNNIDQNELCLDSVDGESAVSATSKKIEERLEQIHGYLKSDDYANYGNVHGTCVDLLSNTTLGSVLNALRKNTEIYNYLRSRAFIREFMDNFIAIVKFNYFKLFENEDYIFFELIEKAKDFLDDRYEKSLTNPPDQLSVPIDFKTRKNIYEKIIEFTSDEFIQKAREFIKNENIDQGIKRVYLKKLKSFK